MSMADYWFDPYLWIGMVVMILILWVGHWITRSGHDPADEIAADEDLLQSYVFGVGAILSGLLVWFVPNGWFVRWLQIAAFAVAAGVAVVGAHEWDLRQHFKALRKAERERKRLEVDRGEME